MDARSKAIEVMSWEMAVAAVRATVRPGEPMICGKMRAQLLGEGFIDSEQIPTQRLIDLVEKKAELWIMGCDPGSWPLDPKLMEMLPEAFRLEQGTKDWLERERHLSSLRANGSKLSPTASGLPDGSKGSEVKRLDLTWTMAHALELGIQRPKEKVHEDAGVIRAMKKRGLIAIGGELSEFALSLQEKTTPIFISGHVPSSWTERRRRDLVDNTRTHGCWIAVAEGRAAEGESTERMENEDLAPAEMTWEQAEILMRHIGTPADIKKTEVKRLKEMGLIGRDKWDFSDKRQEIAYGLRKLRIVGSPPADWDAVTISDLVEQIKHEGVVIENPEVFAVKDGQARGLSDSEMAPGGGDKAVGDALMEGPEKAPEKEAEYTPPLEAVRISWRCVPAILSAAAMKPGDLIKEISPKIPVQKEMAEVGFLERAPNGLIKRAPRFEQAISGGLKIELTGDWPDVWDPVVADQFLPLMAEAGFNVVDCRGVETGPAAAAKEPEDATEIAPKAEGKEQQESRADAAEIVRLPWKCVQAIIYFAGFKKGYTISEGSFPFGVEEPLVEGRFFERSRRKLKRTERFEQARRGEIRIQLFGLPPDGWSEEFADKKLAELAKAGFMVHDCGDTILRSSVGQAADIISENVSSQAPAAEPDPRPERRETKDKTITRLRAMERAMKEVEGLDALCAQLRAKLLAARNDLRSVTNQRAEAWEKVIAISAGRGVQGEMFDDFDDADRGDNS